MKMKNKDIADMADFIQPRLIIKILIHIIRIILISTRSFRF